MAQMHMPNSSRICMRCPARCTPGERKSCRRSQPLLAEGWLPITDPTVAVQLDFIVPTPKRHFTA
jgi:hypothetical protein